MALFTGAFFVAQVSLIIVAKPFYAIFCTSCVPHHENLRIIVGKWKSHATLTLLAKQDCPLWLQYD